MEFILKKQGCQIFRVRKLWLKITIVRRGMVWGFSELSVNTETFKPPT